MNTPDYVIALDFVSAFCLRDPMRIPGVTVISSHLFGVRWAFKKSFVLELD